MFKRLLGVQAVVLVLALAAFGFLAARDVRVRLLDEFGRRLAAELELLRLSVGASGSPAALQGAVHELSLRRNVRFTLISPGGKVLADSDHDPAGMDDHSARPEVAEAKASGRGTSERWSETVREPLLYVAIRLDEPAGAVARAAVPIGRVDREVRDLVLHLLLVGLGVAGVGLVAALFTARGLTRSLRELQGVADWIAAGDFGRRAVPRGGPELERVAAAFNRMADELAVRLESLAAERSKLETVISSMQEGVLALDASGGILYVNGAARRLFDLRDDSRGLRLWEVVRLPGLDEAARRVLQGGGAQRVPFEMGSRIVSVQLTPVSTGHGAVVVARDITEDRRYDNLRKEFVANVSHELRTPLSVIQGYVETLLEGAWRDEKSAPEFLGIVDRNARRLSAIVRDLLDLSRLESGGQEPEPRPFEIRGFLDRVAEAFRPLAERKSQVLDVSTTPGTGMLVADANLLERAVSNLVDNAVKYTPEKGRIRLKGESGPDGVLISVEDDGAGIPEADLPRIFERFYRVDKSRSRDLGGTGLGLAIVKHIVQLHGGSISVRSVQGQGTAFTLRFPPGRAGEGGPPTRSFWGA